jgi:hypothetical protein
MADQPDHQMSRYLESVGILSKNEAGKPHPVGDLLDLHAAKVSVSSPHFSEDGIGSENLRINFGHQPIVARPLQLPDLA